MLSLRGGWCVRWGAGHAMRISLSGEVLSIVRPLAGHGAAFGPAPPPGGPVARAITRFAGLRVARLRGDGLLPALQAHP